MNHVAIMSKRFRNLIEKILSGEKTIESRWSKNKIAPWNKIRSGEMVYFKNAGGPVVAQAMVSKVLQLDNLNSEKFKYIVEDYGSKIALRETNYSEWYKSKNYCVLIFLKNPKRIEPFKIDKTGFGIGAAWMCVRDVEKIRSILKN